MLARIAAVALNAYREAIRARILYGLLGFALVTTLSSLVIGALSLHQEVRVVSDLGSASISLYALLTAIVLAATSLHDELERKTIFPILTRRLRRHEYLLGKYLGALATLGVFVAIDGGVVLAILALEGGKATAGVTSAGTVLAAALAVLLIKLRDTRVYVLLPWSIVFFATMALLCEDAPDERRMVIASALLTLSEVAIVSAVGTLFASFSSPFLTALLTLSVVVVGRSADLLASFPPKIFGTLIHDLGAGIARVVPNLQVYVPARTLLLGHSVDTPVWGFVAKGGLHALFYATFLLTLSALIFRKRDFQ